MDNTSIDSLIGPIIFATLGLLMIIGALRKWKFLIDPPEKMAGYYSQAAIKKYLGKKFLLYETYFLGILFIIVALYDFWAIKEF